VLPDSLPGIIVTNAADAIAFSNALLFIGLFYGTAATRVPTAARHALIVG
jgi:hypothetical protein